MIRLLAPGAFILFMAGIAHFRSERLAGEALTILSAAMVAATIGRAGFDQLVYEHAEEFRSRGSATAGSILKTGLVLASAISLAVALAAGLLLRRIAAPDSAYLHMHFAILPAIAVALIACQLASSTAQSVQSTFISVLLFPVLGYAIGGGAILAGLAPASALLGGYLFAAALSLAYALGRFPVFSAPFQASWLHRARFFFVLNLNTVAFDWGVNLYVAWMLGAPEVLLFAFANRVAAVLSLPLSAITPYLLPEIAAKRRREETEGLKSLARNVVLLTLGLQLLMIVGLLLLYRQIATFGSVDPARFLATILPLIVAQLVNVLGGPAGSVLLMTGASHLVALVSGLVALAALVLGVLAAHVFGLVGVSVVLAAALAIQNICYNWLLHRREGFMPAALVFSFAVAALRGRRGRRGNGAGMSA